MIEDIVYSCIIRVSQSMATPCYIFNGYTFLGNKSTLFRHYYNLVHLPKLYFREQLKTSKCKSPPKDIKL